MSTGIKMRSADDYHSAWLPWLNKPLKQKTLSVQSALQKKTITVLNPAATAAASFEEAEVMIQNKVAVLTTKKSDDKPAYITLRVAGVASADADDTNRLEKKNNKSITTSPEIKWWMKPLFNYVLLPACAIIVGVLITYLLGLLI